MSAVLEARERRTTSVEEAARALGVGRTTAYLLAREQGRLCDGVPVLRVGSRLVVPLVPLLRALGIEQPEATL